MICKGFLEEVKKREAEEEEGRFLPRKNRKWGEGESEREPERERKANTKWRKRGTKRIHDEDDDKQQQEENPKDTVMARNMVVNELFPRDGGSFLVKPVNLSPDSNI